jgi:hypothetical protein
MHYEFNLVSAWDHLDDCAPKRTWPTCAPLIMVGAYGGCRYVRTGRSVRAFCSSRHAADVVQHEDHLGDEARRRQKRSAARRVYTCVAAGSGGRTMKPSPPPAPVPPGFSAAKPASPLLPRAGAPASRATHAPVTSQIALACQQRHSDGDGEGHPSPPVHPLPSKSP